MGNLVSLSYYAGVVALGSSTAVLSTAIFLAAFTSHKASREHKHLPSTLPWVGRNSGEWFASLRANIRGVTQSATLFAESYTSYSLKEMIAVVPTWTKGPQVIIPPTMIPWLAQQPSHVFNAKDCTFENMQFKYTVEHPEITHNDMLDLMIKRELTRTIGTLNDEISNEFGMCLEEMFGGPTVDGAAGDWREVGVWDSMIRAVARTANRVFVGPELCKNDEYLSASARWTRDIQVSGALLHMLPKFLKGTLSWFITIPNRRDAAISLKHTVPLARERIANMTRKEADPSWDWEAPNDLLTWMVRESFKRPTESERAPEAIAYRLLLLNFAAVSTSTIGASNAMLDIIAQPETARIIPQLREEAERVLAEAGGVWTKAAVNKLHRMDSVIRESMRYSGVGGTGLARRIRAEGGVSLPDGTWVPKGATVGVAQWGVHFDDQFYRDAHAFDAFRFSRAREAADAAKDEGKDVPVLNEDMVTTSPHFLAFSHGVHACPGRFFAANQLKLLLAHFVLSYDVKPLSHRPPNTPLGDVMIPPIKATMWVRRRAVKA